MAPGEVGRRGIASDLQPPQGGLDQLGLGPERFTILGNIATAAHLGENRRDEAGRGIDVMAKRELVEPVGSHARPRVAGEPSMPIEHPGDLEIIVGLADLALGPGPRLPIGGVELAEGAGLAVDEAVEDEGHHRPGAVEPGTRAGGPMQGLEGLEQMHLGRQLAGPIVGIGGLGSGRRAIAAAARIAEMGIEIVQRALGPDQRPYSPLARCHQARPKST